MTRSKGKNLWQVAALATRSRVAFEKASALRVACFKFAAEASASKAVLLYQPGEPSRLASGSRSRETPRVWAWQVKAAVMREARP